MDLFLKSIGSFGTDQLDIYQTIKDCHKSSMPFLIIQIAILFPITYFPELIHVAAQALRF
jgi:hypothetical protein